MGPRAAALLLMGAFALTGLDAAGQGDAEDPAVASARERFSQGAAAFSEERYKDAIDLFLEANELAPNPAFSYNIGLAYEHLGDVSNALRYYRDYLRRSPDAPDRAEVQKLAEQAQAKLSERGLQQVTILSNPDGATVEVDGRPVGVTPWTGDLTPGRHQVTFSKREYREKRHFFELPVDEAVDVSVTLEAGTAAPVAPAPAPARPAEADVEPEPDSGGVGALTWIALGVGGVGIGAAVALETMRSSRERAAREADTQIEGKEKRDSAESLETPARIALGVGVGAAVLGGVLLYFDLSSGGPSDSARLASGCTGEYCGIAIDGTF